MTAHVVELWRYPVKSLGGERLPQAELGEHGVTGDRVLALLDGNPDRAGKKLTARQRHALLGWRSRWNGGDVSLESGDGTVLEGGLEELVASVRRVHGHDVGLRKAPGENFDGAPVLLVNMASVRQLAHEWEGHVDHRRFRANLYIDGIPAEAELDWVGRRLRCGSAELEVVHRCARCVVTTVDPDTLAVSPSLLRAIVQRHDEIMGVYCRVTVPGSVRSGDPVSPL